MRLARLLPLAALAACSPDDDLASAPCAGDNLVVIVVDTLRADRLGFHGYSRDTSPFLDELAAESVVFERAYSTSSFTRESISSLLTGRLPSLSGSRGWEAAPSNELSTLGETYRRAGYRTGFFTTTIMLTNERFTRGFDDVDQLVTENGVSGKSHELSERALRFARESAGKPFMMYVHYLDPHGPYAPPESLHRRFADEIYPDPVELYVQLRPRVHEYVERGFGPGDPAYEDQQIRYDAEIVDTDAAIRRLFDGLEELGVVEDTLVVVTSDHGEEFLDHGFVEHAWTLYEESVHVPLLFWSPGELPPARVSHPVSLVDVAPTIMRLQGLSRRGEPTDGFVFLDANGAPVEREAPIVSELLIGHRNVVRSVVDGDWKYVQWRRWLSPRRRSVVAQGEKGHRQREDETPFDPWGPVQREELFDLASDPDEKNDLAKSEPERLEELREVLRLYERRARAAAPNQQGSAEERPDDASADFEALGYTE